MAGERNNFIAWLIIDLWLSVVARTHCELSNSWISFSRSLKQPSEQIELRMSVSTAEIDGMTWKGRRPDMKASSAASRFISFTHQRLHNLHHRQLQFQLALSASRHPGVSVDLRKLQHFSKTFLTRIHSWRPAPTYRQSFLGINFDHSAQKVLAIGRNEVRYVEDSPLDLL